MDFRIVLLTLLSALPLLTTDIYLPAFPAISRDLAAAAWQVQSTMSLYLLGLSVAQLFYGPLSDRFGRRPLLLGGLLIYTLSSLGCAWAPTIFLLQIFRIGQAIGACGGLVLARAMVADIYSRERSAQVLSIIYPIVGLSPILAPIMGGLLNHLVGWRWIFMGLFLLGSLLLISVYLTLHESQRQENQSALRMLPILRNFRTLLSDSSFLAYTGTIVCAYAAYFAYLSQAPFVFARLGDGSSLDSFFYAPTAVSYIAGTMIGRKILARSGLDRVILTGCFSFVIGASVFLLFALAGVHAPWQLFLPMCIVTAGNGMILSFSMAGALAVAPNLTGTASGLVGSLQLGGASLASSLLGSLFSATIPHLAIFVFLATAAALVIFQLRLKAKQTASFSKVP